MSTWVEEFHDFAGNGNGNQFGAMTTGGTMKSTFVPKKQSRKETLEAELKLLEWHKLANDAALKAALMQTKEVQEPSQKRDPSLDEDAKRIRKIITNEQTKPLEVSRDFILKYEKKEEMDSEKLANQVERHIETLRTIRSKLEDRIELKSRINEYRDWKKEFHDKKTAIMNGKTLKTYSESDNNTKSKSEHGTPNHMNNGGAKDLAVVLDSLNKLAQLEARITSLERDNENMFEKMKRNEVTTQHEAEKTALEFKKKRAVDPLQKGAMKTVYTLKTKKVPISKGVKLPKGGTFLTAVERDPTNLREARQREKQRQMALASAGQKQLRERVRVKKTRQLEDINSHRKHEEALNELSKRRSEQKQRIHTRPVVGQGASGGKKFKNKYMNEFNKIKRDHSMKKEQRHLSNLPDKKKIYLSSQTAPSVVQTSGTNYAPRRPPPTTKTAGTVTRRVTKNSIPTRRQYESSNSYGNSSSSASNGLKMPPIVGSGVGGVRALREQRKR